LRHKTITVTRVKPIEEVTLLHGKPSDPVLFEEIVDKEIEETFVKLPRGITDPFGDNLESETTVEKPDDVIVDGVLVKKTIKRTDVRLKHKPLPVTTTTKGQVPGSFVRRTEGEPFAKTVVSEEEHALPDGDRLRVRTSEVTHIKPVEEVTVINGQPSSPVVHDEIIDKEIEQEYTKLPPGITQPHGINVESISVVEKLDDEIVNGVLVKKTVKKTTVRKKPDAGKPVILQLDDPPTGTTIKHTEGTPVARTEVSDETIQLPDGSTLKHMTVTVTNVKPVEEIAIVNGRPSLPVLHDEVIDKQIEETFTKLPPGVTDPSGPDLDSKSVVEKLDDTVVDGIPIKKTIETITVQKKPVAYPIVTQVKGPTAGSFVQRTEGTPFSKTEVSEDQKVLQDGDKLLHKIVVVSHLKPIEEVTVTNGKPSAPVHRNELFEKDIEETFIKLPPGVTETSGVDLESETTVEPTEVAQVNGVLVKTVIRRTAIHRKPGASPMVKQLNGPTPDATIKRTQGTPVAKTEVTEDVQVLPDGGTLKHRTATVTHVVPVEEVAIIYGRASKPEAHEEIIDKEIDETFTKLPPGVTEPSGIGLESETKVEKLPDAIVDGIPVRKTVTTTEVRKKPVDNPIVAYVNGPTPASTIKRTEGTPVARREITEDESSLPDGGRLKHTTVTTTNVKPIEEVTITDGKPSDPHIREEIIDRDIDETFVRLPAGIDEASAPNVESKTLVEKQNDSVIDGILTKKTVTTVTVQKKPAVSQEVGPVAGSSVERTVGSPIAKTEVFDDDKTQPDGSTIKHHTVVVTNVTPITEVTIVNGKRSAPSIREEIIDKEIEETFTKLPPGVKDSSGIGRETSKSVEKLDDTIVDGVLVKKTVVHVTVHKKPQPVVQPTVKHRDGPTPGTTIKRIEGQPVAKTEVTEDTEILPDGGLLKHRVATITHVTPIEEIPIISGEPSIPQFHEEVKSKDIEEDFIKLPPGVTEPLGIGLESETVVEKPVDAIVDGIPVKKTIRRTEVKKNPELPLKASTTYQAGPTPGSVIKRTEGEPLSRTEVSEDTTDLPNGGLLKHKTITVSHVKPVEEVTFSNGQASAPVVHDEIIDKEIEESFTRLPPGITKSSGVGIDSETSVEKLPDAVIDGIPVRKTVKRTTVHSKPTSSPVITNLPGSVPGSSVNRTEGAPVARTEVTEDTTDLPDGGTLKHRTVTVTNVKPIEEVTFVNGTPTDAVVYEKIVDKVIEEAFTKLPPGIKDPCGPDLESETVVENLDDEVIDGIPVRKSIKKTTVNRKPLALPVDVANAVQKVMADTEAASAAQISQFVSPEETFDSQPMSTESASADAGPDIENLPSKAEPPKEKDIKGKTSILEYQRCMDDGTVIRRVVAVTKNYVPAEVKLSPLKDLVHVPERVVGVDIDENVLALPPGLIAPNGENCEAAIAVQNFEKELNDGTPVKQTVATIMVSLKEPSGDLLGQRHIVKGKIESRTSIAQDQKSLEDGSTVRRKIITTVHVQPISELTRKDGKETATLLREKIIDAEIEENVLQLPPGVIEPFGSNCDTDISVCQLDDVLPDGTPAKRKIVKMIVSLKVHETDHDDDMDVDDGDIRQEVRTEEFKDSLDDGTTVTRKVITTKHIKGPSKKKLATDHGIESSDAHDKVVGIDIEENILQLPPGVIEPFSRNCENHISVENSEDTLPDGIPVKRKVVKMVVRLKHPAAGDEGASKVLALSPEEHVPVIKTIEGEIVERVDEKENEKMLPDGTLVRTRTKTKKRLKPKTKVTVVDGIPTATDYHEEVVGADILEDVVQLGPGITEPVDETHIKPVTNVVKSEEKLPDGTMATKTTTTTSYRNPDLLGKNLSNMDEDDGEIRSESTTTESEESLEDGTTIARKVITTKHIKEPAKKKHLADGGSEKDANVATQGKLISVDVEENILQLPPGVIEPFARNCENHISVDNFEETQPDGVPVKRKVVKMIVRLKHSAKPADDVPAQPVGIKTIEGDIVERVDVNESEKRLPDGTLVRTRTETTKRLKPKTDVKVQDGIPTATNYHEEIVGANILEDIVKLGPGVTEPIDETVIKPITNVVKSEVTLPDGTVATKTSKTTSYENPAPPSKKVIEGTVEARTTVAEDTKVLDDGTKVKRRVSTTKYIKPVRIITRKGDVVIDTTVKDELVATDVDERITEMAPGVTEPFGPNVQSSVCEENFDEQTPEGKPQKRKVTRVKASLRNPGGTKPPSGKKLVTRKVRRIGPDGELIEDFVTDEEEDTRSQASSRRSSTSDAALVSPDGPSPSNSELDLTSIGVYADVVEGEPNIETDVQEFEDTLPDSTVVRRRVTTTTETKTILMRALMPDDVVPDGDEDGSMSVIRYTDVTEDQPQTVSDVYDTAESQPDGDINRQRIRTTGRRRLTTERKLICGKLDDEQFKDIGLSMAQASANRVDDSRTLNVTDQSPFDADQSSRLVLRKHVHKKTIIHGGKEETLVTETTHVEQDSDPPPDMSASIDQVIRQFMASDAFGSTSGSVTLTIAAPSSPTSALPPSSSEPHE